MLLAKLFSLTFLISESKNSFTMNDEAKVTHEACPVKVRLPLVTTSEGRAFRRCEREHHFGYRLRYRAVGRSTPLRIGTAVHAALETWWSTCADLDATLARIDAPVAEQEALDEFERAMLRAMVKGYHVRWRDEELGVLFVEREFRAPLINPETGAASKTFEIGGKLDAGCRKPDREFWIVEHKSTSEDIGLDSTYWKRLRMDPQISTYHVGARTFEYGEPRGVIYDVLRKPTIRPYKATPVEDRKYTKPTAKDPVSRLYANQREFDETPDEFEDRCIESIIAEPDKYYMRADVVRLESDEKDAAWDLWHQARKIREVELSGRHIRNPDSCIRYGRTCDFFDVCTGAASLDDPTRFRRAGVAHEELAAQ